MLSAVTGLLGVAWKGVADFVSPYLTYVAIAGVIGIAAIAGVLWLEKNSAEHKVTALQLQSERQQAQIAGLNYQITTKDNAIQALEATNALLNAHDAVSGKIQEDIDNAPAKDDGSLAPVLDRALNAVSGMLHGPAH